MRIASGNGGPVGDEWYRFVRQMGAEGVILHLPDLPGDTQWEYRDLKALREHVESFGLELVSLENTPFTFYDKAMLGLPGTDRQIAHYRQTVRNIGRAGISTLGFCWMPNLVWSTQQVVGRGGALHRGFDLAEVKNPDEPTHGREYSATEIWSTFEYFMTAVLPVAEEFGVTLALHPDDPPVERVGGIERIFRGIEGFKQATATFDSPSFALNFCMGTWSEMGPVVLDALEYFIPQGKIAYIHFRDVKGHVPRFSECFLGEGNLDIVEVVLALNRLGYHGFVEEDHTPVMEGDTPWGHRARCLTSGYIQGVLAAVNKLVDEPPSS